jgi:hypothetical protein
VSHDVADGNSIKAVSGLNISEALQAETIELRAKSEIARSGQRAASDHQFERCSRTSSDPVSSLLHS